MIESPITPQQQPTVPQQSSSPTGILIFVSIALIFGAAGIFMLQAQPQTTDYRDEQSTAQQPTPLPIKNLAPYTLVYGTWTNEGSVLKALDLSSSTNKTLAVLPLDIKKITLMSPETLLYIDKTDSRDYGQQLTYFSLQEQTGQLAVQAQQGYGIDDYVISPNRQYIATWEVYIPPTASALSQGRSRVYTTSLANPTQKNLIYDEPASTPVHYPLAILNDGKVLFDTFQANDPNGATGWAYGMSVANFDGTGKQELPQMANGTYGTQPTLSPDGNYLAFAGYDGTDGTTLVNGYRKAVLMPNTVETLNTATLAREKIEQFLTSNTYTSVTWDQMKNNIIVSAISTDPQAMGTFSYATDTDTLSKLDLASPGNPLAFLTSLTDDKLLLADIDTSDSGLANLGSTYGASIKQFSVKNTANGSLEPIKLPDQSSQYVSLLPADYFVGSNIGPVSDPITSDAKDSLQLYTFLMKPSLANRAAEQQSGRLCRELASEQCKAEMSRFDPDDPDKEGMLQECSDEAFRLQDTSHCSDSPLYLYGPAGQKVKVTVHTSVAGSVPSYNGGYDATLLGDGKFQVNGKTYASITYDYTPAIKRILPPAYGAFVSREDVGSLLRDYAKHLGLNEQETADLVTVGREKVTSPYAFISFYDQKTSEAILPLSFSPRPDNYLNIVFYFKLLHEKPNFSPVPPTFGSPLNRTGLTAVEVSEIVE